MPYYDYQCENCGPFTEVRPMVQSADPCDCPQCSTPSPRAFLSTPNFAMMDAGRRTAMSVNERSSHEPKSTRKDGLHAPGCSCCSGQKKSKAVYRADGAKTFPSARPWMISH